LAQPWTAGVPLPGGDFPVSGADRLIQDIRAAYPFVGARWAKRLVRAYGTDAKDMLGSAQSLTDMGEDFGATLTEKEVRWLMENEYAQRADDVVWRRSKLGLLMSKDQIAHLDEWMQDALKLQQTAAAE